MRPSTKTEQTIGFPYGRARATGGGCFMVFEFYRTKLEAEQGIEQRKDELKKEAGKPPRQFVIYIPELESA